MLSQQLLSNGFEQPRSLIPHDAVHTQFREAGIRASPLCLNTFQNCGTAGRPKAAVPRSRADPTPKFLVTGLFGSTSTPAREDSILHLMQQSRFTLT